jgi:hypothetical protein
MATLAGIGSEPPPIPFGISTAAVEIAPLAKVEAPRAAALEDPAWAPPRAEPGDMGWDLLYGVKRSMSTGVTPRYNFDDDDEPTSEIALENGQG